ncbi:MAG: FG-GAP repeat domain-containing protein [Blastocatellia bacterium]
MLGRAGDAVKVYGWDTHNLRWVSRKDGPPLGNDPYGQAEYYETLQFANVDDQPGAELLVRSPEGMRVFHYNKDVDTWTELTAGSSNLPLSDAAGFNKPEFYQTIQTADLDKDGRAELLARAGDGIYVWKWNVNDKVWNETGNVLPLKGFDQPQYYRTIQTGDVDGDGNPELLLRDSKGVHTYKWTNGIWSEPYAVLGLADPAWSYPLNYLTIQTANLDNVGGAELLARSENGLLLYRLNVTTKAWEGPISTLGLSDANGWNSPQYYQTIKTADLDGDGKAEVIAREAAGLLIYRFTNGVWTAPNKVFLLMNDGADWDQESSYLTIQTGNVDGIGGAEVIGRSHKEIETVHYDADRGFYQKKLVPSFPPFTGSQLDVYKYIGAKILDGGANRDDFRKTYTDEGNLSANIAAFGSLARPANFSEDDWNAVYGQVKIELDYANRVTTLFNFQADALAAVKESNNGSVDYISGLLTFKEETVGAEIGLAVLSFIVSVAAVIPGFGEIPEAAKTAIELAATIIENSVEAANEFSSSDADERFQGTVIELKKALGERYDSASKSLDCQQDYILQDWDLLQSLGLPMKRGNVGWKAEYKDSLKEAGKPGFELEVWKTLVPARWEIYRIIDVRGGLPDDYVQLNGYRDDGQPLVVCGFNDSECWRHTRIFVIQGRGWNYPTQETFSALFDPPPTGLGVNRNDLFEGKNGWSLPYEVNSRPPRPDGTASCDTRCFRSPEYYYQHAGSLPQGTVFVAGSIFNRQINTSDIRAMRGVLRPGNGLGTPTPLGEFNRQYVALQLNLMRGGNLTAEQLDSSLTCYKAKLARKTLSDGTLLTTSVTLRTLLTQTRLAAQQNRAADFSALAEALADLNGNDPLGRCSTTYLPPR